MRRCFKFILGLAIVMLCFTLSACGKKYTVTFLDDDGSVIQTIEVNNKEKITKPVDPTKNGCTFLGWYLNDEKWIFLEYEVTEDLTLTAKYEINQFTVYFINENGTLLHTIAVKKGEKVKEPIELINNNQNFLGWYLNDEKWNFDDNEVTKDLILMSKYKLPKHTITFDTDGGTLIAPITKEYNEPIDAPLNPVREGYEFVGWDKEIPHKMPNEDMVIKAIWKRNVINIFASGPLSGSVSIYGNSVKRGMELAIEEINKAGGILVYGTMMKLKITEFINDEADANKAHTGLANIMKKEECVDFVIGAVTSGATEGLITEAVKHGIPVITPTGTADKLTVGDNGDERDLRNNIFRACFYDSYQGKYMAEYAAAKCVKKVYVLYNNDEDYSKDLKDEFVSTATAKNVSVTVAAYSKNDRDFNAFWVPIIEGGYDCVYVPDYYENAYKILKTGYEKGYKGVCYGCDGWDGLITQAGPNDDISFLENCYYTNHFFGNSENINVKTFVEKYQNKYSEIPNTFAALGYDAVYIAIQAIEKAGSLEYEEVINALETSVFSNLVTSIDSFSFDDGNPLKDAFIITFKDGKEVEAIN